MRAQHEKSRWCLNFWDHSVMEYLFPIDKLQRSQIGRRLSIVVVPPRLSGMSWPT